jgi:DNA-binding NarL/FixJ family response regulator
MRNIYLSGEKKEKEILELCRAGKKCSAIANEMGYSERTIQRRRKELDSRIKDVIRI